MLLLDEIRKAQTSDEEAMLRLISKFLPLLKKYGRKLGYEDAAEDLIADFIEFIFSWNLKTFRQSSEGAAVKYIVHSLYRLYLARLKNCIKAGPSSISLEALTPTQLNTISVQMAVWDEYTLSTIIPDGILTKREAFIISEIYEKGTSVTALARDLHVSRQNINQIKKKAESKLKHLFEKKS